MLLVCLNFNNYTYLKDKYNDYINFIDKEPFKEKDGVMDTNYPINFLEAIKLSISRYNVTVIDFTLDTLAFLDAIKLEYTVVYDIEKDNKQTIDKLSSLNKKLCKLNESYNMEVFLADYFEWIKLDNKQNSENIEQQEEDKQEEQNNENDNVLQKEEKEIPLPTNKNELTLEQLVNEDVEITDADVRDLKATQNKLKVGMLLQAKNSLKRVLKLSKVLDKLYDQLVDRIDENISTTDTASLMYTADYINKALSDTNNFMMSLINNDKIQNFFVIDNSTVINTTIDERADIDSRERVRKAAEIVLDNLDYFVDGDFKSMRDPNAIEVQQDKEDSNVNTDA